MRIPPGSVPSARRSPSAFFDDVPADKSGITLMEILTHTSGMRDIFGSDYDVVSREWVFERAMSAALLGPPCEEERSAGGRALGHARGNEVFNSLQISWIDHDVHLTFFTSCAARAAEDTWRDFRDELIGLVTGEPATGHTDGAN